MAGDDHMATYEVIMPSDYLHILNCICIYKVNKTYKCYNIGDTWRSPATRLTADMYSLVLDNFWNKPTYKKPYYYIHNVNNLNDKATENTVPSDELYRVRRAVVPTDPIEYDENAPEGMEEKVITKLGTEREVLGTISGTNKEYGNDGDGNTIVSSKGPAKFIKLGQAPETAYYASNIERGAGIRYGNVSEVRLEIRYGTDNSVFELTDVYIDYIKAPQNIRLTQLEIDKTEDVSQMLEYPDYVCQEIVNELVHLVMENISDLRLLTHPVVSLSIVNPAQQLAPEAAQGQQAV